MATKNERVDPGRDCDVIMKGGIASGIVYPRALCELARSFRFRSVGGASAGAIAAGMAAAAELGRQTGKGEGFDGLERLPEAMGETAEDGRPRLVSLFQPTRRTKGLFRILLAAGRKGSPPKRVLGMLWALLRAARWRAVIGALPGLTAMGVVVSFAPVALLLGLVALAVAGLIVHRAFGVKAAGGRIALGVLTLVVIMGTPLVASLGLGMDVLCVTLAEASVFAFVVGLLLGSIRSQIEVVLHQLPDQMFGLCTGRAAPGSEAPGLTEWLHARMQALCGREKVLSFGDLREEKVDLRVITTCLTHGRPYLLPGLRRGFYFDAGEMRRLFPEDVVRALEAAADRIVEEDAEDDDRMLLHASMHPRRPFPRHGEIPVIVAVRMSLAFPLLLSAVPLWDFEWDGSRAAGVGNGARRGAWRRWIKENPEDWSAWKADFSRRPKSGPDVLVPERIWFSDGGIASNFPIHLFDAPLPSRPTIGINLNYAEAGTSVAPEGRVRLAQTNRDGLDEEWTRFGVPGSVDPGEVPRFVGSILSAMQNWTDTTLRRVPGYRDRFATIVLQADEGGMNLEMPRAVISRIAGFGEAAGRTLEERFTSTETEGSELSWTSHRWVRLRTSLASLEEWLHGFARGLDAEATPTYLELVRRGRDEPPTSYRLRNGQREVLEDLVERLRALAEELAANSANAPGVEAPRPMPELRPQPRLHATPEEG